MTFDLLIKGGKIIDGSGGEASFGDIGIVDGRIVSVGELDDDATQVIDAEGLLVTPGFVDIHTHYDGQATWEQRMRPSSDHGVTTVVMGNCGVGFAPCRPTQHDMLIRVMEGVEDIPEIVMSEGIPWAWETFPDYLDFLQRRAFDVDCAAYVPHAAMRVYAMGERGARGEAASAADLRRMRQLVTEAVAAGAVGVSTSRTLLHRSSDGRLAPHVNSGREELLALADGLRDAGDGIFQLITHVQDQQLKAHVDADDAGDLGDSDFVEQEVALLQEIAARSGRPLTFSLVDIPDAPGLWRKVMDLVDEANMGATSLKAQIFPRGIGLLFGLDLSMHPFSLHPSYREIEHLPLEERVAVMRTPQMREALLREEPDPAHPNATSRFLVSHSLESFRLGDPPDYDPEESTSLRAEAARRGQSAWDVAYDWVLEDDGHAILFQPINNFVGGTLDPVHEMLTHDNTLIGLGDGGAHYGLICDASFPTFTLTYWTRDRVGPRIRLETAVHFLTRRNALAVGLDDRGLIAPGMKADLNVIDYDSLRLCVPRVHRDLPAGGRRIIQTAEGYAATVVNGIVTYRSGRPTGQLPGRLVRRGVVLPRTAAA